LSNISTRLIYIDSAVLKWFLYYAVLSFTITNAAPHGFYGTAFVGIINFMRHSLKQSCDSLEEKLRTGEGGL